MYNFFHLMNNWVFYIFMNTVDIFWEGGYLLVGWFFVFFSPLTLKDTGDLKDSVCLQNLF